MTPSPRAQATDSPRWTAARLRREALYLESRHRRFELVQRGSSGGFDTYTFSQVLTSTTN